jgi:hypothetical protein
VTDLGITIDVSPLHFLKASRPILMTESGMVTDSSLEHPEKASTPIHVTELGITIDVSFLFAFDFSKTVLFSLFLLLVDMIDKNLFTIL